MKLVGTQWKEKAGGYYIKDATQGFFGEKGEGKIVLEMMGLDPDVLPFSMAIYLKRHHVQWRDAEGRWVNMHFKVTDQRITFHTDYLGNRKSAILFREWESYEDKNDVAHLESEAIGNMSMLCLYDKMVK